VLDDIGCVLVGIELRTYVGIIYAFYAYRKDGVGAPPALPCVKSLFATVASFGLDRGAWEHLCRTPNTQQSVLAGAFLVGCGSLALAGVTVFFTQ
jgi:hypothetical protein